MFPNHGLRLMIAQYQAYVCNMTAVGSLGFVLRAVLQFHRMRRVTVAHDIAGAMRLVCACFARSAGRARTRKTAQSS